MSIDLERALGGIADAAEHRARPVAVDRVLTRLHRRRAARTAVTSAAGIATAGAVALGGATLAGNQRTAPPVTAPSPSPSPTTSAAAAVPSAVTASGAFACGAPVPTIDDPAGDADLHLEVTATDMPATPGAAPAWGPRPLAGTTTGAEGQFLLETAVVNGTGTDVVTTVPTTVPLTAWVVQDGIVVGRGWEAVPAMAPTSGSVDATFPAGSATQVHFGATTLTTCEPGESGRGASAPLEPGPYEVFVTLGIGAPVAPLGAGGEPELTVVGGPFAVTVAEREAPVEDGTPQQPALEDLVLTTAGLGPLAIGDAVPAAPTPADVIRFDPDACAGTDNPERWVAAYPDGGLADGMPSAPFTVSVFEGRVTRIDVRTRGPHTTGGIGVGSFLGDVRAAHPEMTLLSSAGETGAVDAWGVVDGDTTLVVEIAANGWTDGQQDMVVAMALVSGAPYAYPAWGGDTCG